MIHPKMVPPHSYSCLKPRIVSACKWVTPRWLYCLTGMPRSSRYCLRHLDSKTNGIVVTDYNAVSPSAKLYLHSMNEEIRNALLLSYPFDMVISSNHPIIDSGLHDETQRACGRTKTLFWLTAFEIEGNATTPQGRTRRQTPVMVLRLGDSTTVHICKLIGAFKVVRLLAAD